MCLFVCHYPYEDDSHVLDFPDDVTTEIKCNNGEVAMEGTFCTSIAEELLYKIASSDLVPL